MENEQAQLNDIGSLSDAEIESLLACVAKAKDAKAAVYVYDHIKQRGLTKSIKCRSALEALERTCRQNQSTEVYSIPANTKRTMSANRRIHKICKGSRMIRRNDAAAECLEAAKSWIQASGDGLDARSSARARRTASVTLSKALEIPLETARGLVTLLKRTKVL